MTRGLGTVARAAVVAWEFGAAWLVEACAVVEWWSPWGVAVPYSSLAGGSSPVSWTFLGRVNPPAPAGPLDPVPRRR